MATYVLIHGAGADSWYWRPLAAVLRERGHDVVAVDLPVQDDVAGLAEYTDAVVDAVGDRTDLIVVAHSFGGFVGPLVCDRVPVDLLVMLHAQIPAPGEAPGDWWANSGYGAARAEHDAKEGVPDPDDPLAFALHDSPKDLAAEFVAEHQLDQSGTPFEKPWPLDAWPNVPTKVLLSRGDHFFPVEFLRKLAKDRLGIDADEIDGDHCPMLGHPKEVAHRLEAYRAEMAHG
jgi:pimeloyl-ACP methyl ester carboxylesterase